MDSFIGLIENKINELKKNVSSLNNLEELKNKLLFFDKDNIWKFDSNEFNSFSNLIDLNSVFSEEETSLLKTFSSYSKSTIETIKKYVGLNYKQQSLIESIHNKLNLYVSSINIDNDLDIDRCEKVLIQLKNNDEFVYDFDYINYLLEYFNLDLKKKIDIYKNINSRNNNYYDLHKNDNINNKVDNEIIEDNINQNSEDDETILSEDDLVIQNQDDDVLSVLRKYNILWIFDDNLSDEYLKIKETILKYGNSDKIDGILSLLSSRKMIKIFNKDCADVFCKTIIYSNIDSIKEFINFCDIFHLNCAEMTSEDPTCLFPAVKVNSLKTRRRKSKNESSITTNNNDDKSDDKSDVSGTLNKYIGNFKLLFDKKIDAREVKNSCPSFFRKSARTNRKIFEALAKYGYSFSDENGNLKRGFSVLSNNNVLDNIDIAIECGTYDYIMDNITKLIDNNLNLYKIRLALENNENNIFSEKMHNGKLCKALRKDFVNSIYYGIKKEDTFMIYNAVSMNSVFNTKISSYFESVLNEQDSISFELCDDIIRKFDETYNNGLVYNLDGVVISRNKVIRTYKSLVESNSNSSNEFKMQALMYSICRFSMLKASDLLKIIRCINNALYGYVQMSEEANRKYLSNILNFDINNFDESLSNYFLEGGSIPDDGFTEGRIMQ